MSIIKPQFTINDECRQIYENLGNKLFGNDIVLLVLSIAPIKGTTVLQKQVFLTWKEVFPKKTVDLGYFPYRYGAYSKIIRDTVKMLEGNRMIKIIKRKGEGSIYQITDEGKSQIQKRISKLNINIEKLQDSKEIWDEWTIDGTLRYVYRNYPDYTSETKVTRFKW